MEFLRLSPCVNLTQRANILSKNLRTGHRTLSKVDKQYLFPAVAQQAFFFDKKVPQEFIPSLAKTEPKNGHALCENAAKRMCMLSLPGITTKRDFVSSLQLRSVHKMMIDDLSNGASLMKMQLVDADRGVVVPKSYSGNQWSTEVLL